MHCAGTSPALHNIFSSRSRSESLDQRRKRLQSEIAEPDDESDNDTEDQYGDRIDEYLPFGRPGDFLQFRAHALEERRYLRADPNKDIGLFLFIGCHIKHPICQLTRPHAALPRRSYFVSL